MRTRTLLLRTETTTILNWLSPPLASRSLRGQVEAVAAVVVLATIRSTAAQLRPLTQYQRTQHSLNYLEGTRIATRYFPCRSSYRRPTQTVDCRQTDPQPLAHRRAQYRSRVDSRPTHEASRQQHVSDDTRKRARPGDRPTRISSPPPLIRQMLRILLCYLTQGNLLSAKRPSGHATLPSLRH
jgi:hypothetical protein